MSGRSVSATGSALPQQETEQTPGGVGRDGDRSVAAVHPPLSAADRRAIEHLVTEDDTPVDNRFSEKQRRLLTSPLYSSWAGPGGDRPFMVCADVGVFLHPREAPLVPDVFLSLDVNELQEPWGKEGRSYFIWEYKKAPDVVIEVVSNEKGGEMAGKYARYACFGVPLYVVFDPLRLVQEEAVQAWQRTPAAAYRPCGYDLLPGIGLGLRLWQGRFENLDATWLRWQDSSGDLIPTGGERADRQRTRADRERDRADRERDRADQEGNRADRLAALLRAHGISPDNGTTD
ncbi:MAG: Uma2 family endonuclease [Caldilineaceae bacterium]|nr:Uma2 family endonuclease [Caldilineaceae bacterium]